MRIAILGIKTMPAFAGADRVAERLVENLPQHEFDIYVLSGGGCEGNRHYVHVPALSGKHLRAVSYFLLCTLHFLVKGRAKVVHVHNSDFGLFIPLLRLKPGVRVVGTLHGSHFGPMEREKWGRFARIFLRASEWSFVRACHAVTSVAPVPRPLGRPVTVIPNGVDARTESDTSQSPAAEAGLEPGGYVMFGCGRLDRTKGLHHVLAAYERLDDAPPLFVVGDFSHDPAYSTEIETQARADGRVHLHRSLLERDVLFRAISEARVFVFPSEFEAMSMMLLEAIACRTVVVCSDIAENVAVVGGDYPLLFRSRDPQSLAAALVRATGREDDVQPLYDEIVARFRWDEIAERYDALYRQLAA